MNRYRYNWPLAIMAWSALTTLATPSHAQNATANSGPGGSIERLQQQLSEQAKQIEALKQAVAEQDARQRELQRALDQQPRSVTGTEGLPPSARSSSTASVPDANQRAVRVGSAPEAQPPAVAPLFDQPGILTPRGKYVLEPSVQYSYSSSNRVALVGYTIIPALLIGLVDVREVKRNTLTGALAFRYGLSNRLELEGKLPYVYRSDSTISREIFTGSASERVFSTSGKALGDVEFGARYQLNEGGANKPYLIGSMRFKSRTGKDPFDVVTDCATRCVGNTTGTGLPLDLPTGSGFYSLQPGLTWLFPSDPAVFFGGVSYTYNFKRSGISRVVLNGEREFIGDVEPGGIFGINFGMGLALNDKSSFSMGVDLNSVGRTRQNGAPVQSSVRTQLASLLLGYSYRYSDKTAFSVTVGAGLTRDTPDLTVSIRIPMSF
ncbi:acetate kinase [Polaromonas sp.]|uniref:acetate kinase n=1 Tax=Polaromonas sp. TaxID=1869339 RepID=UPI0025CC71C2|nr:acetate kinase [Polaromonas sp.]